MRADEIGFSATDSTTCPRRAANTVPVSPELARSALVAALHGRYNDVLREPARAVPVAHPNGFVKLPLARVARTGRRLFLHVWQTGEEDTQAHDHRWDFSSTVLRGAVHNTLLDIAGVQTASPDVATFQVARYQPSAGGYRFCASHDERVSVVVRRSEAVAVGSQYTMSAFTFHRARALPGTMTLINRSMPLSQCARVLVKDHVSDEPVAWRQVSRLERSQFLRDALDCLV
ncbi:hypothetical protein [Streptomyces cucumeris]|uniref:hypothetical protein n=1 Tax=Streptomyces cucumeris TaxID=2962890 RepID=UPI003EBB1D3D